MLGVMFVESKIIKTKLNVKDNLISIMKVKNIDYISLTDLAKFKDSERFDYIRHRTRCNHNYMKGFHLNRYPIYHISL